MASENGNGYGWTREEWRMFLRRVSLVRFALMLVASAISFAAIGGAYVTILDARIEQNRAHLDRVDATISLHREQIAGMRVSQSATETAAARLEERMTAQGATLARIEKLLERLTREPYGPPRP